MEESFYCPECKNKLEKMKGCGSISYFCNHCNKLISRKAMLKEEEALK
jgi:ribosomal protein L37AE/L43A